jgi:hypothetical protein
MRDCLLLGSAVVLAVHVLKAVVYTVQLLETDVYHILKKSHCISPHSCVFYGCCRVMTAGANSIYFAR